MDRVLLTLLLAILVLFAGCNTGGNAGPGGTDTVTTGAETTQQPTERPDTGTGTSTATAASPTGTVTATGTGTATLTTTAAPTEMATATATQTATATETATATRTATATETATPTATETMTETATPTATPTATATATATETATATATATETETATATPTATETATATATATATSVPIAEQTEWDVTVTEIIDGDTMEVEFENGETETIRLLGVDTPEVHTEVNPSQFEGIPDTDAGREWLRGWGENASAIARSVIQDEEVHIETDEQADRRGSYGRLLVYLRYHHDRSYNEELLSYGYAAAYDSEHSKRETYESLEAEARANEEGIWGFEEMSQTTATPTETATATPTTTETQSGESVSGALAIEDVHEDAAGHEYDNLDDEYIVFTNTGEGVLELGGYTVTLGEGDDQQFTFPDNATLAAGENVRLYTGDGPAVEEENYVFGSGSPILNNGGDTIVVYNRSDVIVLEYGYGDEA